MIGFENLMQVRMMEGAMIFVNKETDEIFFVLENYVWHDTASYVTKEDIESWKRYTGLKTLTELEGPIFFEDDNVAIYFWEA